MIFSLGWRKMTATLIQLFYGERRRGGNAPMVDVRFVDQARRDLASLLSLHPELEEDDVLRQDMIEGETGALELIDKLIEAEREAKFLIDGVEEAIDHFQRRRERFDNRRSALRKYIMQIMESANFKKVERPAATVSIAAGRPKVTITDEQMIDAVFFRYKKEINKEAIGQSLKAGQNVPGAALSNPEPVLRIT
jgi:hypothetical protein